MSLFDTHCHLASKDFEGRLDDVLAEAVQANVSHATVIATHLEDGRKALELSRTKSTLKLFPTLGLHPHEAKDFNNAFVDSMEKEISDYVAVGETGIDYHYDFATPEIQKESFAYHIDLSIRVNKPLVIHCRESVEDIYALLAARKGDFNAIPGIMHCYAEDWEWGKKFLDLGLYLSFSGIITFKNADRLRGVAENCPLDRMLIETDSPYLAPIPYRGKPNQPAYVAKTFQQLCAIRKETPQEIEKQLFESSLKVFQLSA
ncbi:MAG: TatD family hydrolase [Bdellovibrionota bacterium]